MADISKLASVLDPKTAILLAQFLATSGGGIPQFADADPLPVADQGLIFHEKYASLMTWRSIGAYDGYASINVGEVKYFAGAATPPGYILAAGLSIALPQYAALQAYINAAVVPELRGEFIRTLDGGRGIDAGRAIGSAQADQMQGHYHAVASVNTATVKTINTGSSGGIQGVFAGNTPNFTTSNGADGVAVQAPSTGIHGVPRVGADTHPRNVAFPAFIKF